MANISVEKKPIPLSCLLVSKPRAVVDAAEPLLLRGALDHFLQPGQAVTGRFELLSVMVFHVPGYGQSRPVYRGIEGYLQLGTGLSGVY